MTGVQPTEFSIIENGGYVKYIREGECNLCGRCCCQNVIGANIEAHAGSSPQGGSNGDTDWDAWDGYSHFEAQGLSWWLKFHIKDEMRETPCTSFVDGRCGSWKSDDWLALCRYFPVHPCDIERFPECGFSFRRVDND